MYQFFDETYIAGNVIHGKQSLQLQLTKETVYTVLKFLMIIHLIMLIFTHIQKMKTGFKQQFFILHSSS